MTVFDLWAHMYAYIYGDPIILLRKLLIIHMTHQNLEKYLVYFPYKNHIPSN